jgi:HD superfamily phosphohydrolase YqeK
MVRKSQEMFLTLITNPEILNTYKNVVDDMATHDLGHVKRVIMHAERLAYALGLDVEKVFQIKIAALLHDVGCGSTGKGGHAERSYLWVKARLPEVNNAILTAIREHSEGAKTLFGKILTVADKLDICRERILPFGMTVVGNRQYGHLVSVEYQIDMAAKTFRIQFKSDGRININEMTEYYFTAKLIDAVKSLASEFNLSSQILVDKFALA